MKIAFVTDRIYPYYFGGYERRAWLFARELAKEHSVFVFTSCNKDEVIEGVHMVSVCKKIEYFNKNGYRKLYRNILFALFLSRKIFNQKFDIIDCNATPFFHIPIAKLMSNASGAKFFITVHEALSAEFLKYGQERKFPLAYLLSYCMKRLYFLSHNLGDRLIAVSKNTYSALRQEQFKNVVLIPNGLPSEYYKLRRSNLRSQRICYFGRLAPNKNLDVLVEAFAVYRKDRPDSSLHFIGGGGSSSHIKSLANSLSIADFVHFYGEVDEQKKVALIGDMDCFVMPSLREGFSIVTMEALALRVPVIVAYNPSIFLSGIAEFAEDKINALYFDGSSEDLVLKIKNVFENCSETSARVEQGYLTACKYNVNQLSKRLLEIYAK